MLGGGGKGSIIKRPSDTELGHLLSFFPSFPWVVHLFGSRGRKVHKTFLVYYLGLFIEHVKVTIWKRSLTGICALCECLYSRSFPELLDDCPMIMRSPLMVTSQPKWGEGKFGFK